MFFSEEVKDLMKKYAKLTGIRPRFCIGEDNVNDFIKMLEEGIKEAERKNKETKGDIGKQD